MQRLKQNHCLILILQEVWTLCRVFKRTPTLSRYVPEQRDKRPDKTKQTVFSATMDFSSKSCSLDSDHGEHCLGIGDAFMAQQSYRKPMADEQQYCWSGKYSDSEPHTSFWDMNENRDLFTDMDWGD